MSFLQPWLLAALPLVALPIIIPLINQRRYQTVRWAAMMFLLAANRMSRGYARLRQWLIMLFRMLAIAALVFAVSRPLASGWLGLTAGRRAETTIVLLDRSPSMQQSRAGGGGAKLATGRQQLAQALETLGSRRWVLIESASPAPHEIDSAAALRASPATEPTSAPAELPPMLQAAYDYIQANKTGSTDIWICSDVRENDWNAESGRWQTLRQAFLDLPQSVRFHLLAYPEPAIGNVSIRVTDVRENQSTEGAELLVSLRLSREGGSEGTISVPVQFEINGARSELTIEMDGPHYDLKEHRVPLEVGRERGWGRVSIPADANPADNDFYFAFDAPVSRRTVIVADDENGARPLQLAAGISPDPAIECLAEFVAADHLTSVEWEQASLLLWQAPLPEGIAARLVEAFIDRGGVALFLPPETPGEQELFGVRWKGWSEPTEGVSVENWRGDQDLLARTQSGAALPVGELRVRRYCGLAGEFTPLATLPGGAPLLVRATTSRGGAYFCATTAAPRDSTLATGGVVLYVLVQRSLAEGAAALGATRQLTAGETPAEGAAAWQRLAGDDDAISTEYPFQRGVYAAGARLLAVNRGAPEDQAPILADARVASLFEGLDFTRVDDRAGSLAALVQEIWRLFLASMMISLIVEAGLCLPRRAGPAGGAPA
jgi:hypothetical protein